MYCSRCGAQAVSGGAFCSACGAPLSGVATQTAEVKRPGIVTLLAVLQLIGAGFLFLLLLLVVAGISAEGRGAPGLVVAALVLAPLAFAQLVCGVGLLKLRPYGRTLQIVFSCIGLLAIPFGTIVGVLILVYLSKPGIKLLFSGKPPSDFTPAETAQIAADSKGGAAVAILVIAVLVIAVALVGIIAAIAIPGLLRARMSANETSAISWLRAINSAETSYAAICASGGFAVTLDDLNKPPRNGGSGFVSPGLASNGVIRGGYIITLERDAGAGATDVGTAAATCNGSTNTPASSYFARAEPVTPGSTGIRYYATDARGIIFWSAAPIANPIVESPTVVPIQ